MSLSAQLFGRDSFIHRATNVLGLGIPGWLDRKFGPKDAETPSPTIPTVQDSAYGNPIPRFYGTIGVSGNVIWLKGGKLDVTTKKKSGGKGGQSTAQTTYSYFATFALALGEGPIAGIRRMWCGDKLIYNASSDDLETIIASNQTAKGWKLYLGTDDQQPDPDIQADKGVENTPAYRGLAYIKFKKFALKDYGDSLAGSQFKVEVVTVSSYGTPTLKRVSAASDINQTNFGTNGQVIRTYSGNPSSGNATFGLIEHYPSTQLRLGNITRPVGYRGNTSVTRVVGAKDFFVGDDRNSFLADSTAWSTTSFGATWLDFQAIVTPDILYVKARNFIGGVLKIVIIRRNPPIGEPATVEVPLTDAQSMCIGDDAFLYAVSWSTIYRIDPISGAVLSSAAISPAHSFGSDGAFCWYFEGKVWATSVSSDPNAYYLQSFSPSTGAQIENFSMPSMNALPGRGVPFVIFERVIFTAFLEGNSGIAYSTLPLFGAEKQTLASVITSECELSSLLSAADIDVSMLTQQVTGYRIAGGSIRDNIEPLRAAYPFDARMHGFKLQFLPRGQSSMGSVPWGDLAATDSDEIGDSLPYDREMDTQLPAKITAKGISANREYADSSQTYERIGTSAVNSETIDLGLVLSDDEIAQIAEKICELRWQERQAFSLTLPPTYQALEPGDVLTVTSKFGIFELRFTEVSIGSNGIVECKASLNNAALYTSNAVGASSPPPVGTVPLDGPSILMLLDIPTVDETVQNEPGFVGVMTSPGASWPGGVAIRSNDNGQTWQDLQAFVAKGSLGVAQNKLNTSTCTVIDLSVLNVSFISGEPESITRDQMLAGAHYVAYGADGRWEIMRFQNAVLQTDGTYNLSGFVRGEKGTEWATGTHAAGDYLVLLEDPDNAFIGSPVEAIGLQRLYRGVTSGASLDSATDIPFTYRGVNLECLSPVYAKGSRDVSSNFSGTFTRRSRLTNTWWINGVVAPVGEASESYEIDVMQGSTVKRTISATSPAWSYSAANQTTDFGSPQSSITFRIYQLSATAGRGYPLEVTL
ncbi:hypothetical protein IB260_00220 [Pseudomonas sp. PDM23]|uniref:phage tail protein n=1 Tax=unclassified Pseudomonas TaxID=196821 RepID=UPI001786B8A7|nr:MULTISPECIES: phage tail protein [unclassified Pseudomonas]MBD9573719.1 hypothetical protein [Pseudomonas sp. PDM23]MBD9671556.1 hypothetical protein [Pseudomonas sp. PDM21]